MYIYIYIHRYVYNVYMSICTGVVSSSLFLFLCMVLYDSRAVISALPKYRTTQRATGVKCEVACMPPRVLQSAGWRKNPRWLPNSQLGSPGRSPTTSHATFSPLRLSLKVEFSSKLGSTWTSTNLNQWPYTAYTLSLSTL